MVPILFDVVAPAPTEGVTVVEADEGQGDYGEYNEEEEEEDGDKVLLDKRVTLSSFENGSWKVCLLVLLKTCYLIRATKGIFFFKE